MKAADIWGACPFRRVGWAKNGGWYYICGKNDEVCDPNYCLGPDEEGLWGNKTGPVVIDEFIGGKDERGGEILS